MRAARRFRRPSTRQIGIRPDAWQAAKPAAVRHAKWKGMTMSLIDPQDAPLIGTVGGQAPAAEQKKVLSFTILRTNDMHSNLIGVGPASEYSRDDQDAPLRPQGPRCRASRPRCRAPARPPPAEVIGDDRASPKFQVQRLFDEFCRHFEQVCGGRDQRRARLAGPWPSFVIS
jgi:hypothetical protein